MPLLGAYVAVPGAREGSTSNCALLAPPQYGKRTS